MEAPLFDTTPPLHMRLRGKVDRATERLAHRAALSAAHLLGLAAGCLLRDFRRLEDPLAGALARLKEAELTAKLAFDVVDLLSARLDKIPDRHRPYYTPAQRFRILEDQEPPWLERGDRSQDLPGLFEHDLELGEAG